VEQHQHAAMAWTLCTQTAAGTALGELLWRMGSTEYQQAASATVLAAGFDYQQGASDISSRLLVLSVVGCMCSVHQQQASCAVSSRLLAMLSTVEGCHLSQVLPHNGLHTLPSS
jgi:hypothetical protein